MNLVRFIGASVLAPLLSSQALAYEDFGGICMTYENSGESYAIPHSYRMTGDEIQKQLNGSMFKYGVYTTYLVVLWEDGGFTALNSAYGMGAPSMMPTDTRLTDQDGRAYIVKKSFLGTC